MGRTAHTALDQLGNHHRCWGGGGVIVGALQREGAVRRNKRLVVMDMDSTLIINEVIDEIARIQGVFDEVSVVSRPFPS